MKKLYKTFFEYYDVIFLVSILLIFCIDCSSISLTFRSFEQSSILLIFSILLVSVWFIFRIFELIRKFKRNFFREVVHNKLLLLLVLIVFFCCLNIIISTLIDTGFVVLNFSFYKKTIIFFISLIFSFLIVSSKRHLLTNNVIFILLFCFSLVLLLSFVKDTRNNSFISLINGLSLHFSNPNFTSMIISCLILCLSIFLFSYKNKVLKLIIISDVVLLSFLLYFTSSRNGLFCVITTSILFLMYFIFKDRIFKNHNKKLLVSIILFSPLIFSSLYFIYYRILHGDLIYTGEYTFNDMGSRFGIWKGAYNQIIKNPIFGRYYSASDVVGSGSFQYHNALLDLIVAYGLLPSCLTILYFYLLVTDFINNNSMSRSRSLSILSFLGIWLLGIFEAAYVNPGMGMYVLFFLPLFIMQCPIESNLFKCKLCLNNDEYINLKCDVLLINSVYGAGSTGKIVKTLNDSIAFEGKTFTIFGRGKTDDLYAVNPCSLFETRLSQVFSKITNLPYSFNYLNTFRIIKQISSLKPNVVHIHNLNDNFVNIYLLLKYLGKNNIKTVLTHHSEYFFIGNCGGYALGCENWKLNKCANCPKEKTKIFRNSKIAYKKMEKAFGYFKTNNLVNICVSPWLQERVEQSSFLSRFKCTSILNGIQVDRAQQQKVVLNAKKDNDILFVTASTTNRIKGFQFIKSVIKQLSRDLSLTVISPDVEQCTSDNIGFVNVRNQRELFHWYSRSKVTIILSKKETFSMPVAESLMCGTPVVGFMAGGPESIDLKEYCSFVQYGDLGSLVNQIEKTIAKNYSSFDIFEKAYEKYGCQNMISNYKLIYNKFIKYYETNI